MKKCWPIIQESAVEFLAKSFLDLDIHGDSTSEEVTQTEVRAKSWHGGFHKCGYLNSWMVDFREQKPWKMDDLEVPPFKENPCIWDTQTVCPQRRRSAKPRGKRARSATPGKLHSRRQFGVSGWMFYPPNMGNSRTKYGVIPVSRIMVRWSSNCHEVLISNVFFQICSASSWPFSCSMTDIHGHPRFWDSGKPMNGRETEFLTSKTWVPSLLLGSLSRSILTNPKSKSESTNNNKNMI